MKQMEECLDRFFDGKPPLRSKKLKAFRHPDDENVLLLYHYHHLLLVVHLKTQEILHTWWELPTDKRCLEAALISLNRRLHKDVAAEHEKME